jgi:hypothetical protein
MNPSKQIEILKEYHDSPTGGHQGAKRTYERLKLLYKWPKMMAGIEKYICNSCDHCQKNKVRKSTKMPMVLTETAKHPWERVYLDVVGGKGALPTTHNGNKYILTFQDDLSKFSEAIAIPNQEADTIAKAFISRIILKHGPPVSLLTDQGTNFLSNLFKSVCKFLKIKKVQTCAFTPRSNGQLEKSHRGLLKSQTRRVRTTNGRLKELGDPVRLLIRDTIRAIFFHQRWNITTIRIPLTNTPHGTTMQILIWNLNRFRKTQRIL